MGKMFPIMVQLLFNWSTCVVNRRCTFGSWQNSCLFC